MTQAAAITLDPRDILKADAASKNAFIARRLLRFCHARTKDRQQAQDMASEAIALTLAAEGWHRWSHDGVTDPAESLLMHLCTMARDVLKKERERAATWREVKGNPERDPPAGEAGPAPGEKPVEWAKEDDRMRCAEAVMERLDEDARRMLTIESQSEEELDADELAEKLGWNAKQVYGARKRVVYHRDAVLAAERKRGGSE